MRYESSAFERPYLVIPKLVEQPTWGGHYIAQSKGWSTRPELEQIKIGQSYELFSGSNLSLLTSTDDPDFMGELADRDSAQHESTPPHSIALRSLLADSPERILGHDIHQARGGKLNLLIKFTQALGNSYQIHIKTGLKHPVYLPKPESWYFFEPGKMTLGVKPDIDWRQYRDALTAIDATAQQLGQAVLARQLSITEARQQLDDLIAALDPEQYVQVVYTQKDELADLTDGGIHHSWEEDPQHAPNGNILYELQAEAMDDISTFRSFDKGKLDTNGQPRAVHIDQYFEFIDRSAEANTPAAHLRQPENITRTPEYEHSRLLSCPFYSMEKLVLHSNGGTFTEHPESYKHLFVKSGGIRLNAAGVVLNVAAGHSCFIPAATAEYTVTSSSNDTEVLVSY